MEVRAAGRTMSGEDAHSTRLPRSFRYMSVAVRPRVMVFDLCAKVRNRILWLINLSYGIDNYVYVREGRISRQLLCHAYTHSRLPMVGDGNGTSLDVPFAEYK